MGRPSNPVKEAARVERLAAAIKVEGERKAGVRRLVALQRRIATAEGKVDQLRAERLNLYRQLSDLGVSASTMADAIGQDRSAITVAVRRADARAAVNG